MKRRYKIFLASSVTEFAHERMVLKDFTRRFADTLIDQGIRLRMFICEYADNAIVDGRMQSEYNKEIEDSDLFLLLAGERLGQYTIEEYEYALNCRKRCPNGGPRIVVAFRTCENPGESVLNFAQLLDGDVKRVTFSTEAELKNVLAHALEDVLPMVSAK